MIICPTLPKDFIRDAMKALNTDKEITVEASYVQWLQNHPNEDRLPTMKELKQFNTSKSITESSEELNSEADDIIFHISKKKHPNVKDEIIKKRIKNNREVIESAIDEAIDFLDKLENNPELNIYVEQCITWLKNDTVRLPQDNDTLMAVFKLARKNNLNVQQYNSPFDLIKAVLDKTNAEKPLKEAKPVDPNKISGFHYSQTIINKDGEKVDIYDVDETEEGKLAVSQVLADTSIKAEDNSWVMGDFTSPWCLATFNYSAETGKVQRTSSANHYWGVYNKDKRQIAFVDGFPIAFRSTDKPGVTEWWSYEDQSYPDVSMISSAERLDTQKNKQKNQNEVVAYDINNTKYTFVGNELWSISFQSKRNFSFSKNVVTTTLRIYLDNGQVTRFSIDLPNPRMYRSFNVSYSTIVDASSLYAQPSVLEWLNETEQEELHQTIKEIEEILKQLASSDKDSLMEALKEKIPERFYSLKDQYLDLQEISRTRRNESIAKQRETSTHRNSLANTTQRQREAAYANAENQLNYANANEYVSETEEGVQSNIEKDDKLRVAYDEFLHKEVIPELEKTLKKILKEYHIEYVYGDLTQAFGDDILGAFDVLNKIIYLADNKPLNAITGVEEFSHAFIELMGSAYHKEENRSKYPASMVYSQLRDEVEKTTLYQQTLEEYKDNPNYQLANGQPDLAKIKKEALGKALATAILQKYNEKVNINDQDKSFLDKIAQWFEEIIKWFKETFKDKGAQQIDATIDNVAESILNGTYKKKFIEHISTKGMKHVSYKETLKKAPEKAKTIMRSVVQNGGLITGSLSIRQQSPLYRKKRDSLHDIDVLVPRAVGGDFFNSSFFSGIVRSFRPYTLFENGTTTPEEVTDAINKTRFMQHMKQEIPDLEVMYAYPDSEGNLVVNAISCSNPALVEKFKSLPGNFNSRLEQFSKKEREQIFLIDFFYRKNNDYVDTATEDAENQLKLTHYKASIKSKLKYGRVKDVFDYQRLNPFNREYRINGTRDNISDALFSKEQNSNSSQLALDFGNEESNTANRSNDNIKSAIRKHSGNWSRQEAENNPRTLYVFTDNTDRDSGSGMIPKDSWYSKKYGEGHHYPTMTAAVVRGLDNSRPISTQRWYHKGAKGTTGRWTDADVDKFEQVIREELEEIVKEFNTGKYDTIMFPDGDGLFNTKISNITKERTPQLYQALAELLHEYGFDSLIPKDAIIKERSEPSNTNTDNTSGYVNHSGGALGSDSYWGNIGAQYGVQSNHYYHGEQTPLGNSEISETDYEEGRYEAAKAANYNYGYQLDTMKNSLLIRNWAQVKYADAVFAIGHLVKPGERLFPGIPDDTRVASHAAVQGGTGYAVAMAILHGKPVYVYDQERKQWYKHVNGKWSESDTPKLTKNFAGIGTRNLNEDGKKAIEEVYQKTFPKGKTMEKTIKQSQNTTEQKTFADQLAEFHQHDSKRMQMLKEMTADEIYEASRLIQLYYNNIVETTLHNAYKNPEKAHLLSGNKWQDKAKIAETYTPKTILEQVKIAVYDNFVINEELDGTEAQRLANLIIKYFDQLIPYAGTLLKATQPVSVDGVVTSDEDIEDQDYGKVTIDSATLLEHWQTEHLATSVFSVLDPLTKDVINSILDYNKISVFGHATLVDPKTVNKTLIDIIGSINKDSEMIPTLMSKSEEIPWMSQILDLLCGKNTEAYIYYPEGTSQKDIARRAQNLQALFWHDFHKPFLPCASLSSKGVELLNTQSNDRIALQNIQDTIQSQSKVDDKLIYGIEGKYNEKGYNANFDKLRAGNKVYNFFIAKDRNKVSQYKEEINTIVEVLHSLGLNTLTAKEVENLFAFGKEEDVVKLRNILFKNFFNERKDNNKALNGLKNNSQQTVFSAFFTSYQALADLFYKNAVNVDENRFTITVDGEQKIIYSNVTPNVMITVMNKFKQAPTEVQQFILDNYLYDFHYLDANGNIPNIWLAELYEGETAHNSLVELVQLVSSYEVSYEKEGKVQADLTRFETYMRSKETKGNNNIYALYSVGTFADAKASYYIRNKVRSNEQCVDAVTKMFLTEIDRITYVRAKRKALERTAKAEAESSPEELLQNRQKRRYEIENFDKRDYFLIFPNLIHSAILGPSANIQEATEKVLTILRGLDVVQREEFCKSLVNEQLTQGFQNYQKELIKEGLTFNNSHAEILDRLKRATTAETYEADLKSYYFNQFLANLCIDNFFCVDYAFFKHTDEKQKRFKMNYSPYSTAYTSLYLYDNQDQIQEQKVDVSRDDKGNPIEYFILLKDNKTTSLTKNMIIKALKDRVGKFLTKEQYDIIIDGLNEINLSDGQAYRSLESWRTLMNMLGKGQDERTQRAIEKILNGTWDYEAYQCALEVWKPFVASVMKVDTGVTEEDFEGQLTAEQVERFKTLRAPTMHKNSEFLLLAMYPQIQGIVKQSPKLRALNRFMSDFGIDKAQFESANKVSNHGAINLNNEIRGTFEEDQFKDDDGKIITPTPFNVYQDQNTGDYYGYDDKAKKYTKIDCEEYFYYQLCSACGLKVPESDDDKKKILYNQGYNNNVIHCETLENWGIITNLPEHLLDHETGGLGTQAMKISMEDLPDDAQVTFNLNGKDVTLTGKEVFTIYQNNLAHYVQQAFTEIDAKFNNPVELKKFLQKSLAQQTKVPQNLDDCLEIDTDGTFKLSPLNPIRNNQFLSFCASLVRKELIKRNVKQGLLPQVANYGLEDALLLRYQDNEGHMIFTQKEFAGNAKVDKRQQAWLKVMQEKYHGIYRDYAKSADGQGNRILYMEIALPLYDNGLKQFVDKETGHFDLNAFERVVSPEAREAFGYRTPTEAKHSMVPIYIKEFLPFQNASCVMMAMDWILISGSDMDSDKLFTFLPELEFKKSQATGEIVAVKPKEFKVEGNGTLYENILSSISKNDKAANNNLLLWLMRGVLQTKENLSHVMTPNGFDTIRKTASIEDLLHNPEFTIVERGISDLENGKMPKSEYDELLKMSLSQLKDLNKQSSSLSPADPMLRTAEQTKNMIGLQAIARFAVFRTADALIQRTETTVRPEIKEQALDAIDHIPFILDKNKDITDDKINREKNSQGQYITDIDGEFLGTSVDNAKDPLLEKYGIELPLIPYANYLLKRGYNINTVSLFFSQPIIKQVVFEYNLSQEERSLRQIIKEKLTDLTTYEINGEKRYRDVATSVVSTTMINLYKEDLALAINSYARNKMDARQQDFQYVVLRMFEKIMPAAEQLNDITSLCRNSTVGGAIASMETDMLHKYLQYENAKEKYSGEKAPILGLWDLIGGGIDVFEDTLRDKVLLNADKLFHNISFMLSPKFIDFVKEFSKNYLNNRVPSTQELGNLKRFTESYIMASEYLDVENHIPPHMELLQRLVNMHNLFYGSNVAVTTNQDVVNILTASVPRLVGLLKSEKILTGPNEIFSTLVKSSRSVINGDITVSYPTIQVLGNKSNPDTLAAVKRAWQSLYDNYDQEHTFYYQGTKIVVTNKDIADLLFLYQLQTTGIMPKYNNFIDAMPEGYETLIPNYTEVCNNLEYTDLEDEILESYIKNYSTSTSAVHTMTLNVFNSLLGTDENAMVFPSEIRINSGSNALTYFTSYDNSPYAYVGVRAGNAVILYKHNKEFSSPIQEVYQKVNTAGIKDLVNEYFGETIMPINISNELTPNAVQLVNDGLRVSTETSIDEQSGSQALRVLFGENIDASIIKIEDVTSKEVDETGIKICATIK